MTPFPLTPLQGLILGGVWFLGIFVVLPIVIVNARRVRKKDILDCEKLWLWVRPG
jgi:hypothetical protein